jgi:hypothetical protein
MITNPGETKSREPKNIQVTYARATREHANFRAFDDTAGAATFTLGSTVHNLMYGKELPATFFGFDAVNSKMARLLVCFGVPAVNNPREQNAEAVRPYIVYVPDPKSNDTGMCHVFDCKSQDLYLGIVMNLFATALNLPDQVRPMDVAKCNEFSLGAVKFFGDAKMNNYDTANYRSYPIGGLPDNWANDLYSRNGGVSTE